MNQSQMKHMNILPQEKFLLKKNLMILNRDHRIILYIIKKQVDLEDLNHQDQKLEKNQTPMMKKQ